MSIVNDSFLSIFVLGTTLVQFVIDCFARTRHFSPYNCWAFVLEKPLVRVGVLFSAVPAAVKDSFARDIPLRFVRRLVVSSPVTLSEVSTPTPRIRILAL